MAEGLETNQQLLALQRAAREVMPDLGTVAEVNRGLLTDLLTKEGYDLKNNNLEAATRAWQHRNGLSVSGLDSAGGPDVVTLALIGAKYDERLPKGATPDQIREFALANLTEIASDRTNGSKMDAVFEKAGLAAALAAPVAAAPVAVAPELDAMGNPIIKSEAGIAAAHEHAHGDGHDHGAPAADPLGDFIREKDKPAVAAGPDLGTRVGEGVDAAKAAGGKLASDAAAAGGKLASDVADGAGRAWDNVTGAFKDLGKKLDPAGEDPAVKAEREAKLKAAADDITRRANEMRQGAGELATGAMTGLGNGLKALGDGLKRLSGDEPAAPAADAAPAAAQPPKPAAKVKPTF